MYENIIIKVGGTYSMIERPQQVLVMPVKGEPLIFSHDKDITHALKKAVEYIENNLINVENEYSKKIIK